MSENTLMVQEDNTLATAGYNTAAGLAVMNQRFDVIDRAAEQLSKCSYLPASLKGKKDDCAILIELSIGSGIPAFMLAQEIYVVQNRFSFSSKFIIGQIRRRYPTLDFEMSGEIGDTGDVRRTQKLDAEGNPIKDQYGKPIWESKIISQGRTCLAYAIGKDGKRVEGVPVSMAMAKAEGWYDKSSSKWQTMPEVMLRYRAAMFFKSFVCPDVVFGFKSIEEERDVMDADFEIVDETPRPSAVKRLSKAHAEIRDDAPQTPVEKPKEPKAVNSPKAEETPTKEAKSEPTEAPQDDAKDEKPLKKLRRLLAEEGLTDTQCKNYCRKNGMLSGGKVDEFAATKILNAWDTVVEFIRSTPATEEDAK